MIMMAKQQQHRIISLRKTETTGEYLSLTFFQRVQQLQSPLSGFIFQPLSFIELALLLS